MADISQIIIHGNLEQLKQALPHVSDLNYLDEYGYSPLIECAIVDDLEKARLLLECPVDLELKDLAKRTALSWAVSNNNMPLVELLLEKGSNPNVYSLSGEPLLVKPLLGGNQKLKKMLLNKGASVTFANDYVYAKLLGHRYELVGSVDIVDPNGVFVEVDYEGFYFDFSLSLIRHSILDFQNHYVAKNLHGWLNAIEPIASAIARAGRLLHYDNYLTDYRKHIDDITRAFRADPIVIPIGQEGHAFTLVKAGSLLAICDRAKDSDTAGAVPIYYINRLARFDVNALCELMYGKQNIEAIKGWLRDELMLTEVARLPLRPQRMGNCSWANSEAVIPALFTMLQMNQQHQSIDKDHVVVDALELYQRWRDWDRQRALQFFINTFQTADAARRASIAALLAGVVFQTCSADHHEDVERAKRIINLLHRENYQYVWQSYIEVYVHKKSTAVGKNLMRLLEREGQEQHF